jgi:hypothetical protein
MVLWLNQTAMSSPQFTVMRGVVLSLVLFVFVPWGISWNHGACLKAAWSTASAFSSVITHTLARFM